jgi:hypothetical protein
MTTTVKDTKRELRRPLGDPSEVLLDGDHINSMTESEIKTRAYYLWEERGCPEGSPETDWFRAREELVQTLEAKPAP